MPRLTKALIEAAQIASKPIYLWDQQISGFGVKVLPSGKRKYILKYRTKGGGRTAQQRWYLIGTHGDITLDQARDIAKKVHGSLIDGIDPQGQKEAFREALIVTKLWDRFEKEHLSKRKLKTKQNYKQIWASHIKPALGTKKVIDVNRDDIHRLHHRMSKHPYQANRTLSVLSKMFNLAERWNMRLDGTNPCRHVEKYREYSRQRYLKLEELSALGDALREALVAQTETPHMVAAIQLLLITGARVGEILGARWEWVNWESRIIQLPDSKTGAKPIYLSDSAIKVLKFLASLPQAKTNPYIIVGRVPEQPLSTLHRPWIRIQERAGLDKVRLHDLRHTAASIGVSQGMNLPVIGRLLGHTQASTTQRYAHVDIDPALNAANKIGDVVANAIGVLNDEEA
jgi:integrase